MNILTTMVSLTADDVEVSLAWHTTLLGRSPDRNPMDGTYEWDLGPGSGLQVSSSTASAGTVILGVEDIDVEVAALRERGGDAGEVFTTQSGQFRLCVLKDPARNDVVIAQTLV